MQKDENPYNVHDYSDRLKPGERLLIDHSVYLEQGKYDIAQLAAMPEKGLLEMRDRSEAKETAIFAKVRDLVGSWEAQAAETALTDRAIQYIRVPKTEHTSNIWEKDSFGYMEISNTVYRMSYRINEDTRYDNATNQYVPVAWYITWDVRTNEPQYSRYGVGSKCIAGQNRKRFTDRTLMEKYISGRIKAYRYFFKKVNPPIPPNLAEHFKVNGLLLPGYTVQGEAQNRAAAASPRAGAAAPPGRAKKAAAREEKPSIRKRIAKGGEKAGSGRPAPAHSAGTKGVER